MLSACGSATSPTRPTDLVEPAASRVPAGGAWTRVPDVPLSPRTDPFVGWTGEEVLVIGGNTGWICPPNADCVGPEPTQFARDGAAWDPESGTWRSIAELPQPVYTGGGFGLTDAAVLDGHVVVHDRSQEAWLRYDVAADRWTRLDGPGPGFLDLSQTDGTRVWGLRGSEIVSWDPVVGDLRVERSYDSTPRLDDPRLILADAGPVVTGVRYKDAAPDEPTLALVDIPDGEGWRRVTTGQIGWFYAFVAGRVVGTESGGADGGEVNGWDRWSPAGGAVDPRTGEWAPLDIPSWTGPSTDGWYPEALGEQEIVTGGHYRDLGQDGPWVRLGRPESDLEEYLSAVWAGDRLIVWAGIDGALGYDAPTGPEVWTWTPSG